MTRYSRRELIKGTGLAGVAAVVARGAAVNAQSADDAPTASADAAQTGRATSQPQHAAQAGDAADQDVLRFFSSEEAQFVRAAIDRLIPADDQWGGAVDAGVLRYIDRQLASAYGAGARLYLDGPWDPDAPEQQGYQLKYSPADL